MIFVAGSPIVAIPSHSFENRCNVVNQNGVIRFLDGQTGKVVGYFDKLKNLKLLRTN